MTTNDLSKGNMDYNAILLKKYKPYGIFSEAIIAQDKKNFIATVYHGNKILLKFKYVLLGSYSKENNLWIWADQSIVLDKTMLESTKKLKEQISHSNIIENLRKFLKPYTVLPMNDLYDHVTAIEKITQHKIISTTPEAMIMSFFLIKKILVDNIID